MNLKKLLSLAAAFVLAATLTTPAGAQNFSSVQVLNGSCTAPSFTFANDNDSGFYLVSAGIIAVCVNGAEVGRFNSNGLVLSRASVSAIPATYSGTASKQAVEADLNVGAGVGSSTAGSEPYIAGVMGNVIGADLTATRNYLAGVVGKYSLSGVRSTTYSNAGVLGIAAGRTEAAVGAEIGSHDSQTDPRVGAMFKVFVNNHAFRNTNPVTGATVNFGLDLYDARNGYTINYSNGDIRMGGRINGTAAGDDVVIRRFAGVPVDGASGTCPAICGRGSLIIDTTNGTLYQNTGTLAAPTWTAR